jgi:hypothetical protein
VVLILFLKRMTTKNYPRAHPRPIPKNVHRTFS